MRYIKFILAFIILCSLGCSKKEAKVEIYLLKERAEILDGIDYVKAKGLTDTKDIKKYEHVKYDTVFNQIIYSGRFAVDSDDLQSTPFISDKEILSFKIKNNKFVFSKSAIDRIESLSDSLHNGIQFAIAVDGRPHLTAYFKNISVWCDWYYIRYWREGQIIEDKHIFDPTLYNGYMRGKHEDLTPPYPPELIEAFRSSGRLIE